MSLGLLFWVLMLVTLAFGLILAWPRDPAQRYVFGGSLLWWLLLAIVGWGVFGPPLRA
jgi:hypothetical protein